MDVPAQVVAAVTSRVKGSKTGKVINRPHYRDLCEELSLRCQALEQEIDRLRANGADKTDLAKIKAESFAAGVAAASAHFSK